MAILYTMVFVGCDAELTATVMSVLHVNGELANRRPARLALSGRVVPRQEQWGSHWGQGELHCPPDPL